MKHFLSTALAAIAVTSSATAQQIVFHEGFEGGLAGWNATGLWNLQAATDPCGSHAAPFVEGIHAAWFGSTASCNFDTGAPSGALTMTTWVTLPDAPSISLRFWSYSESEYCWGGWGGGGQWDVHRVVVSAQNGPNAGFAQDLCAWNGPAWLLLPWHERRIDLSAYRGADVRVSFEFSAFDSELNAGLGWLVDDVSILAEPGERICPGSGLNSGCPCAQTNVPVAGGCRNSTGQSATLLSGGTPSVAQDTLVFTAAHMPATTLPTLFQGTLSSTQAAFGDGLRCIGGTQLRLGTLTASNGVASWPPAGGVSLSVKGLVPPEGGTRYYQVLYRNAAVYCNVATFNLTDAQRILWVP